MMRRVKSMPDLRLSSKEVLVNPADRIGSNDFWSFMRFAFKETGIGGILPRIRGTAPCERERMFHFKDVALELFRTLALGWVLCLDAFLFLFTFLPLRICFSGILASFLKPAGKWMDNHRKHMQIRDKADFLRLVLILMTIFLLSVSLDMSKTYHWIRGQSTFKLYVIFNILQVLEKLCTSFGEDILLAFFSNCISVDVKLSLTSKVYYLGQSLLDFIICLTYTWIHCYVILLHIVSLNVSINSKDSSLVALLVSNNFVEVKGSAFKRYSDENLFQIVASDAVELFNYSVYIVVILIRNQKFMQGAGENMMQWVLSGLWSVSLIFIMEIIVDWIKHSFITKFNLISPSIYTKFRSIFYMDSILFRSGSGRTKSGIKLLYYLDRSDAISRRLGFVPVPLGCVMVYSILQTYKSHLASLSWCKNVIIYQMMKFSLLFMSLCLFKVFLSISLLGGSIKAIYSRG